MLPAPADRHGRLGLKLIAAFKFVKAASLVAAALGAMGLLRPRNARWAEAALEHLALSRGHRLASSLAARALPFLEHSSRRRIEEVAIGALLYAAVFAVEGTGLALGKRWAEYLTVAVTISFLPFESVALARHATAPRAVTLVLNVAVVVYLVWQLRAGRAGARGHGRQRAPALGPS